MMMNFDDNVCRSLLSPEWLSELRWRHSCSTIGRIHQW